MGAVGLAVLIAACSVVPGGYDAGLGRWSAAAGERPGAPDAEREDRPDARAYPRDERHGSDALPGDAGVDGLVAHAERHSPALAAAHARWRAALEQIPQATSLPDPRLTLAWFADEVETRTGPMDWRIGLSQSLPWFGKLDLAGRAAVARAEVAALEHETERLALAQRVRDAWHEWVYLDRAVEITASHRDIMLDWEEVARSRYATGLGSDADLIRAQVELGKLDDAVATLDDLRRPVAARLNAELDRAPDAPLPAPHAGTDDVPPLDETALRDGLLISSPDLLARQRAIDAAAVAVELADLGVYPDVTLGIESTRIGSARASGVSGSGDDALALTLGFDLPIRRGRIDARLAQAEAQLSASRSALAASHRTALSDLELALYRVRDADRRVRLFRDTLIPKGRQAIESLLTAYQTDAADFLQLVDAERVLLDLQLAAARAQADRAQALAIVRRLAGGDLHTEPRT